MKRLSFLLLMACSFCVKAQTAEDHYKAGVEKMRIQKYSEAIAEYNKALEMNASYEDAWYYRGLVKFIIQDASSEDDFLKVIALNPKRYKAFSYLGMIKFRTHDYNEAIQYEDRTIALQPDYAEAYFYRGDSKMEIKDFDGALADLDKAISLKPDFVTAYYTKGLTEFLKKDYAAAISVFARTIEFNDSKNLSGCYYFRGLAEAHTGKKDAACADLDKALSLGFEGAAKSKAEYCN